MAGVDRKARIREYKETPRPAGVFRVVNTASGRALVGSTVDLPGMLNRQRFQLECGSHADSDLQRDWDDLGPDAFTFEVLDELDLGDEPAQDVADELAVLKQMWIERLATVGASLYSLSGRRG